MFEAWLGFIDTLRDGSRRPFQPVEKVQQKLGFFSYHGIIVMGDAKCWKREKWSAAYLR